MPEEAKSTKIASVEFDAAKCTHYEFMSFLERVLVDVRRDGQYLKGVYSADLHRGERTSKPVDYFVAP